MYKLPPVKSMSKQQIRQEAFDLWLEFVAEVGSEYLVRHGVDFDEFYDAVLYPKHEITLVRDVDLGVDDDGVSILGKYLPKENTAFVDRKLFESNDPRKVFTEIHESIGHGILHGAFLRENAKKYPKLYTTEDGIGLTDTGNGFNWKKMNTFELQANAFAVNAFAPRNFVWCIYRKVFEMDRKIIYCGPGIYCLVCNKTPRRVYVRSPLQLAWVIAKQIQPYFWGLSAQSLSYQVLAVAVNRNNYQQGGLSEWGPAARIGEVIHRD
jgi:hypothetical protein